MVRLEALCEVQQDSLQNQQDKFKPEVENTGAFPVVLAKGNVELCQKDETLEKRPSSEQRWKHPSHCRGGSQDQMCRDRYFGIMSRDIREASSKQAGWYVGGTDSTCLCAAAKTTVSPHTARSSLHGAVPEEQHAGGTLPPWRSLGSAPWGFVTQPSIRVSATAQISLLSRRCHHS